MRKELANIAGVRMRFTATFVRFGKKNNFKGKPITTLLFENIRDKHGKVYTDHLWFSNIIGFERMHLTPGDKICFDARVAQYTKGYKGYREDEDLPPISTDYRLSHPTNIIKHSDETMGLLF